MGGVTENKRESWLVGSGTMQRWRIIAVVCDSANMPYTCQRFPTLGSKKEGTRGRPYAVLFFFSGTPSAGTVVPRYTLLPLLARCSIFPPSIFSISVHARHRNSVSLSQTLEAMSRTMSLFGRNTMHRSHRHLRFTYANLPVLVCDPEATV